MSKRRKTVGVVPGGYPRAIALGQGFADSIDLAVGVQIDHENSVVALYPPGVLLESGVIAVDVKEHETLVGAEKLDPVSIEIQNQRVDFRQDVGQIG